jgi:hypothetical protein
MDSRFLKAYTDPSRFQILGKDLYPFCLKYRVWLTAFNSPLVIGGTVGPEDLLFAVNICSESPVGKFNVIERWRLLRLASNPARFQQELKRFADYTLVEHWPKFWQNEKKGSSNGKGIPWPLGVVTNLIAAGIEEKRAWEMPECQAIWMNASYAISKGAELNVLSSEEEDMLDELDKAGDFNKVANPAKIDPSHNVPRSSS